MSTATLDGDLYVQACVHVDGNRAFPYMHVTSNGYHTVSIYSWLNVNGSHQDYFSAPPISGAAWSEDFAGTPVTIPLTGHTYVQGQGTITVDGVTYGAYYSQSVYAG